MSGYRPEVADVFRIDGAAFLNRYRLSKEQYRVFNALQECRTAALGACCKRCDKCGHEVTVYCSCRNRHCPKCQGAARAAWLQAREREVLDVEYFHVVFTMPHELSPLALQNRRVVYGMLFRAASETLQTLTRDPKHLGCGIWLPRAFAHLGTNRPCASASTLRDPWWRASAPTANDGSVVAMDFFYPFAS